MNVDTIQYGHETTTKHNKHKLQVYSKIWFSPIGGMGTQQRLTGQ